MSVINWLVVLSTLGTLLLLWALFIVQNFNKNHEKTPIDEEEERLVELMGKVRIFVDSKIEQLDEKMEEVRNLIKELNDQYIMISTLSLEKVSNIEQRMQDFNPGDNEKEKQVKFEKSTEANGFNLIEEKIEDKDHKNNESLESKIYDMYLSGMEPIEIAKSLKMGLGEVQLVLDLMKRQKS
ncbi:MAG: DUF6115 domain-containing protein [Fervidobacterium sp.]